EVHVQQRGALVGLQPRFELLEQERAVRKAGQRIVHRRVNQAAFGGLALQVQRQGPRQRLGRLPEKLLALEGDWPQEQQQAQRAALLVADRREEGRVRAQRARAVALGETRVG